MIVTKKLLLYSTALLALGCLAAVPGRAETVRQNTTVTQVEIPNAEKIDFSAFDLNKDGVLSRAEVGEKLFYVFDVDGNHVIDNIEFNRKTVLTFIPMESQTVTAYDFNDDGHPEVTKVTYSTFMERSGLARFEKTSDGLAPSDFLSPRAFNQLDVNKDKVIDIAEWKGAYIKSLDKRNKEAASVNP
jgi:hypothetical protein